MDVVVYFMFQVGMWNYYGPLVRVCLTVLVGPLVRVVSEGKFMLSPLLLLLENMNVVVLAGLCCLVWGSDFGGFLVRYGWVSRWRGD